PSVTRGWLTALHSPSQQERSEPYGLRFATVLGIFRRDALPNFPIIREKRIVPIVRAGRIVCAVCQGRASRRKPDVESRSQALPGNARHARLCLAEKTMTHAPAGRACRAVRSQAEPGNEARFASRWTGNLRTGNGS